MENNEIDKLKELGTRGHITISVLSMLQIIIRLSLEGAE